MGPFNWVGHYGLVLSGGNRCLAHNVLVTGRWAHPFSTHQAGNNHVFSQVTSLVRAGITHKSGSDNTNTWTDIDLSNGTNLAPASRTLYWNIRGGNNMVYPDTSRHCVAVGIKTNAPGSSGVNHWHETISQDSLYPQNIYLAQLAFRGKPLPESTLTLPPAWPAPNPGVAGATDDSYVNDRAASSTHGGKQTMIISQNLFRLRRPYLKFEFQESVLDQVQRAVLRVFRTGNYGSTPNIIVFGIEDDSWTEGTITYDNQPAGGIGAPAFGIGLDTISSDDGTGWLITGYNKWTTTERQPSRLSVP